MEISIISSRGMENFQKIPTKNCRDECYSNGKSFKALFDLQKLKNFPFQNLI
jgi:hypothetical protein